MKFFILITSLIFLCACSTKPSHEQQNSVLKQSVLINTANYLDLNQNEKSITVTIISPETNQAEISFEIDSDKEYKIISSSSTINGMLSILDQRDHLVGINKISYVNDQKIIDLFNEKKISEFEDVNNNSTEKIIASGANILLYNGYGTAPENAEILKTLGVECIPVYDWKETEPLGKAEWIKLIGALTHSFDDANNYFTSVQDRYNELKLTTKSISSQPTVLAGHLWGDSWNAPAGESYVAQLINDAGGDYIYKNTEGTGSISKTMEEIISENEKTEIWLNPGVPTKNEALLNNPHLENLKCFNNSYCYSANLNEYWEMAAIQPDRVLEDFIAIFNGQSDSLNFYRKLN